MSNGEWLLVGLFAAVCVFGLGTCQGKHTKQRALAQEYCSALLYEQTTAADSLATLRRFPDCFEATSD